jgi:thiamine kinase-like enzyme
MNHHEIIRQQLSRYFNVSSDAIHIGDRLRGGMSNSNYIVTINDQVYVFRIPGKNASTFVSRKIEQATIDLIAPTGIDGHLTLNLDLETGYKISRYVAGTPLFLLHPDAYYPQASACLHQLHDAGLVHPKDYDPFGRLHTYEGFAEASGMVHGEGYAEIKASFLSHQAFLSGVGKVMCHNDAQPSNFIWTEAEKMWLVDWEFGGMNDPLYDVACFGNNDFTYAKGLLPVYLGRKPKSSEWMRLFLWRVFQCLQWHNVALYKEAIGLSQELNLDFKHIADQYIAKAHSLYREAISLGYGT